MGSRILIQSVKRRAFLNQVAAGAIATGITLTAALTAAQTQIYSPTFAKGRVVVSQSGSGQSGSFAITPPSAGGEWSQENLFGLTQELIELIQTVINNGSFTGQDDGQPGSTSALMAIMVEDDSLYGVTQQQGDWTSLNVPSIGGIPAQ